MPDQTRGELKGLRRLLVECLSVVPEDELLVVCDESTLDYAKSLAEIAQDLSVDYVLVHVPIQSQMRFVKIHSHLPRMLAVSLFEASAIALLISGDLVTMPFRAALLQAPRRREARLAHLPGITQTVLEGLARTDMTAVRRDVERLAFILGECHELRIHTPRDCELVVRMDGWNEAPVQSPGVIHPGSWGNVPPGEVFLCPSPDAVEGTFHVDGSMPGAILERGKGATLEFDRGRLAGMHGTSRKLGRLLDERRRWAAATGDTNWDVLCEIGFGLNNSIHGLTGSPLFDEKAYGTVHVALGDNSAFGFGNRSEWHADFVSRSPKVVMDGVEIIAHRKAHVEPEAWYKTVTDFPPLSGSSLIGAQLVVGRLSIDEGQLLLRVARAGRVGLVRMTDDVTATLLATLYELWKKELPVDLSAFAAKVPEIGGRDTKRLLALLNHFGAVSGIGKE